MQVIRMGDLAVMEIVIQGKGSRVVSIPIVDIIHSKVFVFVTYNRTLVLDFPAGFQAGTSTVDVEAVPKMGVSLDDFSSFVLLSRNKALMLSTNAVSGLTIQKDEGPFFAEQMAELKMTEASTFSLTCVGATVSNDLKHVAIGDFVGNVKIFATASDLRAPVS